MRKISATLSVSMDGVIQAPGRPDEDTRDGFDRGGWAVPYNDEVMAQRMGEAMSSSGVMLFGRRTYQDFYGYWPQQTDNPFTPYLNRAISTSYQALSPSRCPGKTRSCFRVILRLALLRSDPNRAPIWPSLAVRGW